MQLYTLKEVAEILKVHFGTVQRYITEEKIKGVKMGKGWRVSEEELKRYIDSLETNTKEKESNE